MGAIEESKSLLVQIFEAALITLVKNRVDYHLELAMLETHVRIVIFLDDT